MRNCAKIWFIGLVLCVGVPLIAQEHQHSASAHAPDPTAAARAVQDMAKAANNLLATYTPEQKQAGVFELTDAERVNWHFIPKARKGMSFKELTTAQRPLAHALLSSGLSQRGYGAALTIMSLEQILHELEQGRGAKRDPELYFVSI